MNECYHIFRLNTIIHEELININLMPIYSSFFEKDTLVLTKQLLGKLIVHEYPEKTLVGRIVETEAYLGEIDRAAHSFNNLKTKRTEIMYGSPGSLYCYQMHTHVLINVVAGSISIPHAILIRAIEPVSGLDQMKLNRPRIKRDVDLTNGPGKLTKALGISMDYYGHKWFEKPLFISNAPPLKDSQIVTGPRVGIANSGDAANYPWRFSIKDNPFVSNYRK